MRILVTISLLLCTACIAGQQGLAQDEKPEAKKEKAFNLEERANWIEETEIMLAKSAPPKFSLNFKVNMPTPGWKLKVDEVGKPDAQGRIQVKVTATPPEGIVAQVITSQTFHASLGVLDTGDYLVEVHYRKAGDESYVRRGVVLLAAN